MVFQLKIKNKSAKNSISKNIGGFKSILSKVKYVAKNVIYLKKWSSNSEENTTKKTNYTFNNLKKSTKSEHLDFSFKNYRIKIRFILKCSRYIR